MNENATLSHHAVKKCMVAEYVTTSLQMANMDQWIDLIFKKLYVRYAIQDKMQRRMYVPTHPVRPPLRNIIVIVVTYGWNSPNNHFIAINVDSVESVGLKNIDIVLNAVCVSTLKHTIITIV
jgi:hypothetical protein